MERLTPNSSSNQTDSSLSQTDALDSLYPPVPLSRPHKIRRAGFLRRHPKIVRGTLISLAAVLAIRAIVSIPFVHLPTLNAQKGNVQIYDRFDHLLTTVHEEKNVEPMPLERISKNMRDAVIAAEDHSFYQHWGVDPAGIARAMVKNAEAKRVVEGGSTITQQLIKTLYLDPDNRTIFRKAEEAVMSLLVSGSYSKNKVLETYLNQIYFGKGAYGIERASFAYFNKHAAQLTLAESAYLAALIKAPSELSLQSNRSEAIERQHQILDSMVEMKLVSKASASVAEKEKLHFAQAAYPLKFPYYVNHVLSLAKEQIGEDLWKKPLSIYTNIDPQAQHAAEVTLSKGIVRAPRGISQGALVSIAIDDGSVIAMVGGVGGYGKTSWNRAISPHTAGSAFKPFVYLAALISGAIHPDSMLEDAPLNITMHDGTIYSPRNFDATYEGPMTVRDAIARSRNVCAVDTAQKAGLNNVISTAQSAGISSSMDAFPSLALGTCAVSPLEMANSYATLARSGTYIKPEFIRRIVSSNKSINKVFETNRQQRLPEEPTRQIVDAMQDVVSRGTGTRAKLPGIAVAGKTGTADKAKDIWFVGFTPDVVTATWAGNDDNRAVSGNHVTGGSVMAGIWHDYMQLYIAKHRPEVLAFTPPNIPLAKESPFSIANFIEDGVENVENTIEDKIEDTFAPKEKSGKKTFFGKLFHKIGRIF
ncbi:MAG: PBP1A family penicillin-binding protein [Leptolyngbya sp.]|nr:PBP1A family penicillin-binding protein [Candidatus Melainabacteria bacterium]